MYNKAKKTRNQDDWQEFCDIRKRVHKEVRAARVSHISQFLTTSITDKPKSFWTFISKLRKDNQGIGDLLLCPSLHGLQEMVNICADFGTDYHVTFNDKKTTCIMFGTSAAGCKCISVNDNEIMWFNIVKQLGNHRL